MKLKLMLIVLIAVFSKIISASDPCQNEKLWQRHPGRQSLQWESQVFHVGNGYFGLSAYCGIQHEQMTLGEKTFWTGGPGDDTDYNFLMVPDKDHSYLGQIKKLTSEGNIREADKLVEKYLCSNAWVRLGGLSCPGNIKIDFAGQEGKAENYERCLDLSKSLLTVNYTINNVSYSREYLCSYPGRVFAMRITADKPGSVSFGLGLNLMHRKRNPQIKITPSAGMLEVAGHMNDNNRPYRIKIKVVNEGGNLSGNDSTLFVNGSDAATVYYTIATDYELKPPMFRGADPEKITSDAIAAAVSSGYEKVKEVHIKDYRNLYSRTSLKLDNPVSDREKLPTDERLFQNIYNNDCRDLGLKELAFNLGKYILISVSRPGSLPAGLQGTWNNRYEALWNGTYQLDMNVTQNYMFGNALNLSECQVSFIEFTKMLAEAGKKAAAGYYHSDGWMWFIITDIWGGAGTLPPAPFISSGWLSLILWEQFAFDRDINYLKEIYPMLRGAAQFYLENLIEYKDTKKLVFWGTYSGEHSSSPTGVTTPNYQDLSFIAETFDNAITASEILDTDKEFREKLKDANLRLMPYKVGRMGQFQEWVDDIDDPNCRHRHLSHLLGLQPCSQINPREHPELIEAAKVTLLQKGDNDFVTLHRPDLNNSVLFPTKCEHEGLPFDNYTSIAWSRSARVSTWLRVLDGDHADKIYNDILRESTLENMIQYQNRAHYGDKPIPDVPFFIESNVLCAGNVTEMILQSQNGELELLPALPSSWKSGKITGIRGRNACTLDIEWKDLKLVNAAIRSDAGGDYTIRYGDRVKRVTIGSGQTINLTGEL
jgi:alpha-L-fucosidase 2